MALFFGLSVNRNTDGSGTEPLDARKAWSRLLSGVGVLPSAPSPLVTGTSGWAYVVRGPVGWVTQRAAGDGLQVWGSDGDITLTLPAPYNAAPASGLQRYDVIWIRHRSRGENGDTGDTASTPEIGVVSGSSLAVATVPAIPAGAMELARNLVTASATSTQSSGNTLSQTAPRARFAGSAFGVPAAFDANVSLSAGSRVNRSPDGVITAQFNATRAATFTSNPGICVLPEWARPAENVYAQGASFGTGERVSLRIGTNGWVEVLNPVSGNTIIGATLTFVAADA